MSVLILLAVQGWSQNRYFTNTGRIVFYSHTPVEDIEAENHQVTSILDINTGDFVFAVRPYKQPSNFRDLRRLRKLHWFSIYVTSERSIARDHCLFSWDYLNIS